MAGEMIISTVATAFLNGALEAVDISHYNIASEVQSLQTAARGVLVELALNGLREDHFAKLWGPAEFVTGFDFDVYRLAGTGSRSEVAAREIQSRAVALRHLIAGVPNAGQAIDAVKTSGLDRYASTLSVHKQVMLALHRARDQGPIDWASRSDLIQSLEHKQGEQTIALSVITGAEFARGIIDQMEDGFEGDMQAEINASKEEILKEGHRVDIVWAAARLEVFREMADIAKAEEEEGKALSWRVHRDVLRFFGIDDLVANRASLEEDIRLMEKIGYHEAAEEMRRFLP